MMIFTSVYSVLDGLFVSNFVGKTAFAAINLIMPVLNILGTFGYMFGAGGSALIAKTLGEQKREKANRLFSLFVYLSIGFGVLMMVFGIVFMRPIAEGLGAEGQLLEDCLTYGRIFILALPAWILLYEFQLFFVGYNKQLMELTVNGFVIYSFAYLFMGMAIFSSSFFTALNNGLVSAVISFFRTLVFELGAVLLLPIIWEINGIWASVVVAEFMATVVGILFVIGLRKKYCY